MRQEPRDPTTACMWEHPADVELRRLREYGRFLDNWTSGRPAKPSPAEVSAEGADVFARAIVETWPPSQKWPVARARARAVMIDQYRPFFLPHLQRLLDQIDTRLDEPVIEALSLVLESQLRGVPIGRLRGEYPRAVIQLARRLERTLEGMEWRS